jgi:hypothetical protein
VTGGIRRLAVLEEVLSGGVAIAGIATVLAINPALPREWKDGKDSVPELRPVRWKGNALVSVAKMAMAKFQLRKLSRGQPTQPDVLPLRALLWTSFIFFGEPDATDASSRRTASLCDQSACQARSRQPLLAG